MSKGWTARKLVERKINMLVVVMVIRLLLHGKAREVADSSASKLWMSENTGKTQPSTRCAFTRF